MKNSNCKTALGALAIVGGILAYKKISSRRKAMKELCDEYDIKEKTPFGFADKIRDLSDEQYSELKEKIQDRFGGRCCRKK